MAAVSLTTRQAEAVYNTGGSVIVSAAAGSGKTSVLARRAVYLVCEAPPSMRCDVDELLVVTFTDAAAAEMRARIVGALREEAESKPGDRRLREQVSLVDVAQISTIHSFCLWMIRRWFNEAGVDPTAAVLDEHERRLIERDVLDSLLRELYAAGLKDGDPFGLADAGASSNRDADNSAHGVASETGQSTRRTRGEMRVDERLGGAFASLVDVYGLGDDRDIASLILKLHAFTESLPDPEEWLRAAVECVGEFTERSIGRLCEELAEELKRQADHCRRVAEDIEAGDSVGKPYADHVRDYVGVLRDWAGKLAGTTIGSHPSGASSAEFAAVRNEINAFEFARSSCPRLGKDADPALRAARDAAAKRLSDVKKLFKDRLHKRYALFSAEALICDLKKTGPFVTTIVDVARLFRCAYTARKRRIGVLDFSDLERLAFDLLSAGEGVDHRSDVARYLQRRFKQVLVDEFQDINPLQEAIIRLVSRESDDGGSGNLFVVGDVKQSIYGFRLAEPSIFTRRLEEFRANPGRGSAVALPENFRSRPEILGAVNLMFERLMCAGTGGVVYDEESRLRPGRKLEYESSREAVELHVLERSFGPQADEEDTNVAGGTDSRDPALWSAIEREAYLIGSFIRDRCTGKERTMRPGGRCPPHGNPRGGEERDAGNSQWRYRDTAVLLRASKINAERVAAMLTTMGVPAFANVGGSLFAALEVRDVLSALEVFDNMQQDIPLAAVLRSGILGQRLFEDDLVEVRCFDRRIPFHAAVRAYAAQGKNRQVRDRLAAVVGRIRRYREDARCRPLAELLWKLYEEFGYLAYVGGLPNGNQRRANLFKLHDLARRFGSFRSQGLHRFLNFVDSLASQERELPTAPALGESADVVRVMSIHQSKGLEFPVVFVAGLGTRFNLGDRSGRMIFGREATIGLRVVDRERMIEYPSASHTVVAGEVEKTTREEELRILYVAMTRAREKLVLVGSRNNVESLAEITDGGRARRELSLLDVATAMTPLDWLLGALAAAPPGCVCACDDGPKLDAGFTLHCHQPEEMGAWRVDGSGHDTEKDVREAVGRAEALAPQEPVAYDDAEVDDVISRLEYVYPDLAISSVPAVVAASTFKGEHDYAGAPDERGSVSATPSGSDFELPIRAAGPAAADNPAHRGVIMHRVLQHLRFRDAENSSGVASELQRMKDAGILAADDVALVDTGSLEWFVQTPLAEAIRAAGVEYKREFKYIATESPHYFDGTVGPSTGFDVLVRGVVDGILPAADAIEVLDFKTDAIKSEEAEGQSTRYRPQMELYARAMGRMWRRPVRACHLVFLRARKVVTMDMSKFRA